MIPAITPSSDAGMVRNISQMADPPPPPPSLHMFPPGGVVRYAIAKGEKAKIGLPTSSAVAQISSGLLLLLVVIYTPCFV